MARLSNSPLGKISGKLGNLIIYERNGKMCVRSRPEKISVPASKKQIYQRKALGIASSFLKPLRRELEFGFSSVEGENSKRYGKAMASAIKNAILSEQGEPKIYPEKILTSSGDLLKPTEVQVFWEGSSSLRITWRPNSFEGNGLEADVIFYVAYDPVSKRKWSVKRGSYRKSGSMTVQFPWSDSLAGKFYHYLSFYRKRKSRIEFSESICLGIL
jgi:hypothetical protein